MNVSRTLRNTGENIHAAASLGLSVAIMRTSKLVCCFLGGGLVVIRLSLSDMCQHNLDTMVAEAAYLANLSAESVAASLAFCCWLFIESGVMASLTLVPRSLRPMSDILKVVAGADLGTVDRRRREG